MSVQNKHLQLRLTPDLRREIMETAQELGMSGSDVMRGSLHFGVPIFRAMNEIQKEMIIRLVEVLKCDSSFRPRQ